MNETDRELLELAAKAVGLTVGHGKDEDGETCLMFFGPQDDSGWELEWNPLTDDGDALRLAVKLRIDLQSWIFKDAVVAKTHIGAGQGIWLHGECTPPANDHKEPHGACPYSATRRAIVRAAAEIGRGMK